MENPKSISIAAPASELPEWLRGTYRESGYDLMMDDGDRCQEQISLTREEYLAMKVRLAELRGFTLTPEQIENLDSPCELTHEEIEAKIAAA